MKVAVIGGGISGLTAARALARERHDVHLFEGRSRIGGHACTVVVDDGGDEFPLDIGFIVYNERNYPIFSAMLRELGVETTETSMGFSVSCRRTGVEYAGTRWRSLFASPRNLVSGEYWQTLLDFRRFARVGTAEIEAGRRRSLGAFCDDAGLSEPFRRLFLRPMAGAIWSTPLRDVERFPAGALLTFFRNHGLLSLGDRPEWRTIVGGSSRYVEALVASMPVQLHAAAKVEWIRRSRVGVEVSVGGAVESFDRVVVAVHSDQALELVADPTSDERAVLGAIRYRPNDVVLHDDRRLLPRHRAAWSSWNVAVESDSQASIGVTYLMSELQPLSTSRPWCVTLNRTREIDPSRIRHRVSFAHPQFDEAALAAQERWADIDGIGGVHYCGAYWRYGFHEDGAWSGVRAAGSALVAARSVA